MLKKTLQIKDSQVKKNLQWHILRLLRLSNRTKQELIDKLHDMYIGYWQVNNELISESKKVMQGKAPKLEKFSRFLESHLKVLPERGAFVSLWFFNLQEMTKPENLERVKKGFGIRFPIGLKDEDYESIYAHLEKDCMIESSQDSFRITEKGKRELKILAEMPIITNIGAQRRFISPRKINWFAEGL